jgi:hypothetical protein
VQAQREMMRTKSVVRYFMWDLLWEKDRGKGNIVKLKGENLSI